MTSLRHSTSYSKISAVTIDTIVAYYLVTVNRKYRGLAYC